jgi:DNA-binding NarL/FixJ family response regulator
MGLEILDSVRGDIRVVLLDYTMPGFAGAETLQYVRETTPAVKVVPLAPFIPQRITSSAGNGTDGDTENSVYTKELIETIDLLAAAATAA